MTAIVEGIYKHGHIELLHAPANFPEGPIRAILIAGAAPKATPSCLIFGKYSTGRMSSLEDFQHGEWRGEEEFGEPHGQ
jgi:hypothetical protein